MSPEAAGGIGSKSSSSSHRRKEASRLKGSGSGRGQGLRVRAGWVTRGRLPGRRGSVLWDVAVEWRGARDFEQTRSRSLVLPPHGAGGARRGAGRGRGGRARLVSDSAGGPWGTRSAGGRENSAYVRRRRSRFPPGIGLQGPARVLPALGRAQLRLLEARRLLSASPRRSSAGSGVGSRALHRCHVRAELGGAAGCSGSVAAGRLLWAPARAGAKGEEKPPRLRRAGTPPGGFSLALSGQRAVVGTLTHSLAPILSLRPSSRSWGGARGLLCRRPLWRAPSPRPQARGGAVAAVTR